MAAMKAGLVVYSQTCHGLQLQWLHHLWYQQLSIIVFWLCPMEQQRFSLFLISCSFCTLALAGCGRVITLTPTPVPTPTATVTPEADSGQSLPPTPYPPPATPVPYTPQPPPTPTITPTRIFYTVQVGDNLESIARRYNVSVAALQQAHNISDPRTLQTGQRLVIPHTDEEGRAIANFRPTPVPVVVQNVNISETVSGGLWVLGEIRNDNDLSLEQVRVGVALLGKQNERLAEADGLVALNMVGAGEVAPFALLFDEVPGEFTGYQTFLLQAIPAYVGAYYQDLVVENLTSTGEQGSAYTVKGTVRNSGAEKATNIQVVLTAYDLLGRVIATRKIVLDQFIVGPGTETTFTEILVPMGGAVARVHAVALGRAVDRR